MSQYERLPWFKFHCEWSRDSVLRQLPPEYLWRWVVLMGMKSAGELEYERYVSTEVRNRAISIGLEAKGKEKHGIKKALLSHGLIDNDWFPTWWGRSQNLSDARSGKTWKKRRTKVFDRDNYTCTYCGKEDLKIPHCDHIVPVIQGGTESMQNLTTACATCNLKKNDKTPTEWFESKGYGPGTPEYLRAQEIENRDVGATASRSVAALLGDEHE